MPERPATRVTNAVARIDQTRAVRISEAARRLSVSSDFFEKHILPDLRIVRVGSDQRPITLVPTHEIERWIERHAYRVTDQVGR